MLVAAAKINLAGVLLFMLVGTSLRAPPDADQKRHAQIKLPDDPAAVVITFDYDLGNAPRVQTAPYLTVRADGKVKAVGPALKDIAKAPEGQLSKQELQALLRFILEDQQFFDFDFPKVKAAIVEKEGHLLDATGTIIRVKRADKEKEVKFPLLQYHAARYSHLKQLQQLRRIEIKLDLLRTEILVGGKEELAKGIKLANQELKKQFPAAPALSENDITGSDLNGDGTAYVNLHHAVRNTENYFNATLEWPAKGKPKVKVDGNAK
jgi:hypothetical protein